MAKLYKKTPEKEAVDKSWITDRTFKIQCFNQKGRVNVNKIDLTIFE